MMAGIDQVLCGECGDARFSHTSDGRCQECSCHGFRADPAEGEAVEMRALEPQASPPLEPMLRWFTYSHLPEPLQNISAPFSELANSIAEEIRPSAERTVALRKLLEAKDAAVRASLPDSEEGKA